MPKAPKWFPRWIKRRLGKKKPTSTSSRQEDTKGAIPPLVESIPTQPSKLTEKPVTRPQRPPSTTTATVILLGRSGSGKSFFVKEASSQHSHIPNDIQAPSTPTTSSFTIEGQKFELINSPSFDNLAMTDIDAFTKLAEHLLDESNAKTGISAVIYIHCLGDPVESKALTRNMGVISDVFLGDSGLSRLKIMVVPAQPGTPIPESTLQELSRTGAFREACRKGAQVLPSTLEKEDVGSFLLSHACQEPVLLRIQHERSKRPLSVVKDEVEEYLGYYERESHKRRLEEQVKQALAPYVDRLPSLEASLKERDAAIARYSHEHAQIKQQLARSLGETATTQQKHQQTQKEYASLRSQLQLQENVEQGEIVQVLKDLNREIDDIGRAISEHLVDNHVQKAFSKEAGDTTALDARHLPELKTLLDHVEGSSSLIASSSGAGMPIEDFFDYATRSLLCKYLCKRIFSPFHPAVDPSRSDFVSSMYSDVQQRESQAAAAKWRANSFKSMFNAEDTDEADRHINRITEELALETLNPLISYVFGQEAGIVLENQHLAHLARLVRAAWNWNSMLKGEVIMLGDFHQTYYPPLHEFDPTLMSEFEPNTRRPQAKCIIGTLALGLTSSKAVGGGRAPETTVVYKALVATEGLYE